MPVHFYLTFGVHTSTATVIIEAATKPQPPPQPRIKFARAIAF
jgi:hypothetical protein